jgi:AraC-like DNA-binding protein
VIKTVSSFVVKHAADLIAELGVDPGGVARVAGVPDESLHVLDLPVDARSVIRFLHFAAKACREPAFGMELAQRHGLETLGTAWILARHASTVGEALRSLQESLSVMTNAFALSCKVDEQGAMWLYFDLFVDEEGASQATDLVFSVLCRELRSHAGSQWRPTLVRFRHGRPPDQKRHFEEFGKHIHFNQDVDALFIDSRTTRIALDPSGAGYRLLRLDWRLNRRIQSASFATRVEHMIRGLITTDSCTAQAVADQLSISIRTLQHHLARHGTSYTVLFDSVRESLARKYLRDSDLSIGEIAEVLKFADTSSFSRFFKNHVGKSPKAYRNFTRGAIGEA